MPGDAAVQRREGDRLGMWIFLATEAMLFGGLFTAYACYRLSHGEGFAYAAGRTDFWLGASNTAVVLVSSLTMALSVEAGEEGRSRRGLVCLLLTAALGCGFLALKGLEYAHHVREGLFPGGELQDVPARYARDAALFFTLYFIMTGLHALHMAGGIVALLIVPALRRLRAIAPDDAEPLSLIGLYWHFVDVVWIFLFPMFYLSGRR